MKKFKKTISAMVALIVFAGALCGCTADKKVSKLGDSELSYWASVDAMSRQTIKSYEELLMYQEMEKRTGVHINFIHPNATANSKDAFNLLTTSKDLPDMIEYTWTNYTGGPDAAIEDGLIIALNDYLKEHAPNFMDYMEGKKGKANQYLYKAQALTDRGRFYGFNNLSIGTSRGFGGLTVRKDLLDKWGMNVPITIDDWSAIFAKAKEEGITKPFTCVAGQLTKSFNTGFDLLDDFYVVNGKIKFGPAEKGYEAYIQQLSDWCKAGYIDIDFVTNDAASVEANITNGVSIATVGGIGSTLGKILPAAKEKDATFDLVACPYPVAKKGDIPMFQDVASEATSQAIAISSKCKKPEIAVEWCDYLYSEEGMILKCFGIEGDTFKIEEKTASDGTKEKHYVYTEKITDFRSSGAQSVSGALYKYFLPANHPGLNQHPDYLDGYYQYQQQKDALVIWNKYVDVAKKHVLPTLSYTIEESEKITDIQEAAQAELKSNISNVILGKADISTLNEIVKTAMSNGYSQWQKIVQTAYDRYLKRLKK